MNTGRMEARVRVEGKSRKSQRGAAALEFALVVPILIVLVFGIADFGFMFNNQAVVSNAARDAARAGSFSATQSEISAIVNAEVSYLPNITFPVTTTVTCQKPSGAACSNYDVDKESGGTVTVSIVYVHNWMTPALIGVPNTSTITKVSQMRIE